MNGLFSVLCFVIFFPWLINEPTSPIVGQKRPGHAFQERTAKPKQGIKLANKIANSLMRQNEFVFEFIETWSGTFDDIPLEGGRLRRTIRRSKKFGLHDYWYAENRETLEFDKRAEMEALDMDDGVVKLQRTRDSFVLIYFPAADLQRRFGYRAGGLALLTGITACHTSKKHDLFAICDAAGFETIAKTHNELVVKCKTDVGAITIWIDEVKKRLTKIEINTSQNEFRYGKTLKDQGLENVQLTFDRFDYQKPNKENKLGLRSYRCLQTEKRLDGRVKKAIREVTVLKYVELGRHSREQFSFHTKIPDGTRVHVSEESGDRYRWNRGKLERTKK